MTAWSAITVALAGSPRLPPKARATSSIAPATSVLMVKLSPIPPASAGRKAPTRRVWLSRLPVYASNLVHEASSALAGSSWNVMVRATKMRLPCLIVLQVATSCLQLAQPRLPTRRSRPAVRARQASSVSR